MRCTLILTLTLTLTPTLTLTLTLALTLALTRTRALSRVVVRCRAEGQPRLTLTLTSVVPTQSQIVCANGLVTWPATEVGPHEAWENGEISTEHQVGCVNRSSSALKRFCFCHRSNGDQLRTSGKGFRCRKSE